MEFDEHEEQEEEIEMHQMTAVNYQGLGNSTVRGNEVVSPVVAVAVAMGSARKNGGGGGGGGVTYRYKECLKNHAVGIGGQAVDGCGEFMAAGEEGTLDALKCAVCNCHRNFHRKEIEGEGFNQPHHPPNHHHHGHHSSTHHQHQFSPFSFRSPHPSGYLHVTPQPRPLALPSTSRDDEDMSNPSSSGGGAGGGGGSRVGGSKKRFRTKFTQEQKDKMLAFAESVGWRIQKQDEAAVQQFCAETNVKRHVLKVWMHNNKHTLGKKP